MKIAPLRVNRVRELRVAAGLLREDLAKRADLLPNTVARLDANPSIMPRLDVAVALSKALGVPVDHLIRDIFTPA